ncbi:hypothetical protein HKX48_007574 [Thoreauomyces humboldtii]|nr:hypothetical protein HKX48_007574 [Thoreauomyces humboldtii]
MADITTPQTSHGGPIVHLKQNHCELRVGQDERTKKETSQGTMSDLKAAITATLDNDAREEGYERVLEVSLTDFRFMLPFIQTSQLLIFPVPFPFQKVALRKISWPRLRAAGVPSPPFPPWSPTVPALSTLPPPFLSTVLGLLKPNPSVEQSAAVVNQILVNAISLCPANSVSLVPYLTGTLHGTFGQQTHLTSLSGVFRGEGNLSVENLLLVGVVSDEEAVGDGFMQAIGYAHVSQARRRPICVFDVTASAWTFFRLSPASTDLTSADRCPSPLLLQQSKPASFNLAFLMDPSQTDAARASMMRPIYDWLLFAIRSAMEELPG